MASEKRYPEIQLVDDVMKIKVENDYQAKDIISRIGRTCTFITEDETPDIRVFLCGGNFYRVRYDKDTKILWISHILPQPPRYYPRREIV